ncbi:MAG: LysR substrate-binding domain-containing protein [Mesorhizobium sp.]
MRRLQRYHLNGLKALEAAGRLGSLQRAADELGVSPGAISQHIIRAEKQMGRQVFSRDPHGLSVTPFGEQLLARLTGGFRAIDDALSLVEDASQRALTVSVAPLLASKWLVPRLARFRKTHPDIRIRIEAAIEIANLDASDVDVGLRVGSGNWRDVRLRKLAAHVTMPVCAPAFAERLTSPQQLRQVPVLLDANAPGFWDGWLKPHGMTEADLGPADSFTDAGLCLEAAIAGQGVMMGWPVLVADAMARGLVCAPFRLGAETGNAYYAATSLSRSPDRRIADFIDWVAVEMDETEAAFARSRQS